MFLTKALFELCVYCRIKTMGTKWQRNPSQQLAIIVLSLAYSSGRYCSIILPGELQANSRNVYIFKLFWVLNILDIWGDIRLWLDIYYHKWRHTPKIPSGKTTEVWHMVIPASEGLSSVQLCTESHHLISAMQKCAAMGLQSMKQHNVLTWHCSLSTEFSCFLWKNYISTLKSTVAP